VPHLWMRRRSRALYQRMRSIRVSVTPGGTSWCDVCARALEFTASVESAIEQSAMD